MNFNKHSERLKGAHAFLSPSSYHWLNYSDEKLVESFRKHSAVQRGTELHELAAKMIKLGVSLEKEKKTLNMYVNDAIGFNLTPEQLLYFSPNCFGTADTIRFDEDKGCLRIHDLKTGETKASMKQLYIYAAIFCLEYCIPPGEIEIETRIYQSDDILKERPTAEIILPVMDTIIRFDTILTHLNDGGKKNDI